MEVPWDHESNHELYQLNCVCVCVYTHRQDMNRALVCECGVVCVSVELCCVYVCVCVGEEKIEEVRPVRMPCQ